MAVELLFPKTEDMLTFVDILEIPVSLCTGTNIVKFSERFTYETLAETVMIAFTYFDASVMIPPRITLQDILDIFSPLESEQLKNSFKTTLELMYELEMQQHNSSQKALNTILLEAGKLLSKVRTKK